MDAISDLVIVFIVNALWQAFALLIIAGVCTGLMRRTAARHKHLVWVAVLILSAVLPILSLTNFRNNNVIFGFRQAIINNQSEIGNVVESSNRETAENEFSIQTAEQYVNFNLSFVFLSIAVCYFLFLLYRFTNLIIIWRNIAHLHHSVRIEKSLPLIIAVSERCCSSFQLNSVPVLFSAETNAPLTLGMRKPVIILPENFLSIASEETLTAALGHESAHIRRRDYGMNLVYEFLSFAVSFHPAVTIMKRNINQTREMACDELVSEHLLKPFDYARSLIQIAGFISSASQNSLTLGVFNADILEQRMMKLIEKNRSENKRMGKIRILFVLTILSVSAITIPAFSFVLPPNQTQAKEKQAEANDYNVEIYANSTSFALLPSASGSASWSYLIFTVKNQTAQTPEGDKVFAFQVFRKIEKDSVQVEILALLKDPNTESEAHLLDAFRKQAVAKYNIKEGEKITLSEMTKFGGNQPLEVRVSHRDETQLPDQERLTKMVSNILLNDKKQQDKKAVLKRVNEQSDTKTRENGTNPLEIISKPIATYTDAARRNEVNGTVKLRVTFLASGTIGDVIPVDTLPDGLTERAVEAAKAIKFQPATENGTPMTVVKFIEYSFTSF